MNQNVLNFFTSIRNTVEFVYIMYKDFEKGLPICFSSPPSNTYVFDGWIPALLLLVPWHTRNSSRKTLWTEQWKGWNQISLGVRPGNTTFFLLVRSTDGKRWLLWPRFSGQCCPFVWWHWWPQGPWAFFSLFSSVQSLSRVQLFTTPWTAARQASLSITNSRSLPKLMYIESVMPSNCLILCHPLLPPSTFPSIRVFLNESALHIGWPKYWSFSFNISPSNEHSGLISFRMDWLDLLAVQGTLKSLLQHHSSEASILRCSAFFVVQLSHPYVTTGKTFHLSSFPSLLSCLHLPLGLWIFVLLFLLTGAMIHPWAALVSFGKPSQKSYWHLPVLRLVWEYV